MSKSTGNAIAPLDLVDTVGVDGFRYYVLADTPYGQDGDFTYDGLVARYNADLANNLGNLMARVATVVTSKCGGTGPAPASDSALAAAAAEAVAATTAAWDVVAPSRALESTWQLVRATNAHLEANEPWKMEPGADVERVLGDALEALRIVAVLAAPGDPEHGTGHLGAHRSARLGARPAGPGRRGVGWLPRWPRRHQGRVAVPAHHVMSAPGWLDSHCHLPGDAADDLVAEAADAGVTTMITIGCDRASSIEALDVAGRIDGVHATVGLHPHEARHGVDTIRDLFDGPVRPVAVGECGLDFHYDHSPRDAQREAFAAQVALAHELGLPLVIHTREAWDDTFDVLDAEGVPERTVFHCFTGGPDDARRCLDRGAYLSFSGIVTFNGAPEVREAAALTPLDRILVETDSPYLAPVPNRGKRNRPAWVPLVGARLAEVHGVEVDTVRDATRRNAERAFGLE